MQADGFGDIRSQGSPGWDKLQFLAPTRPGDVLHVCTKVLEMRASKSRPSLGIVKMGHEVVDEKGEVKTSVLTTAFYDRRDP